MAGEWAWQDWTSDTNSTTSAVGLTAFNDTSAKSTWGNCGHDATARVSNVWETLVETEWTTDDLRMLEQQALWKKAEEERLAKERVARARGLRLLRSLLDRRQREALRVEGLVPVRGRSGRLYVVEASGVYLVDEKAGKIARSVCLHAGGLCTEDLIASTVLALKADEDGTMARAAGHDRGAPSDYQGVLSAARRIAA